MHWLHNELLILLSSFLFDWLSISIDTLLFYLYLLIWSDLCLCCPLLSSIPDDSPDLSSPAASDENIGLFMLRKDSERRATLHRVLTEFIGNVVSNIQESVPQVGEEKITGHKAGTL